MISGPQPLCWLNLMPLSTRTALRNNPLGDLGGSTELVEPPCLVMRASPGDPQPTLKCGLSAVGAQSGWKCAGTPPPLSHACLVSAFAAGAPAGLGRGDLEPHRDLVLKGSTGNYGGPGGGYTPPGRAQPRSKSARARVYHAPPSPPSAGRSALESPQQGHTEWSAGTLTAADPLERRSRKLRV